jgi:hypothetical protein
LDIALRYQPRAFQFLYEDANVIDRNPPPPGSQTITPLAGTITFGMSARATLSVGWRNYPPPPMNFVASPDVETLWTRYKGYRAGSEPLPHMAYFCLTVLEGFGGGRGRGIPRANAADKLEIDISVLEHLGTLVSEKGDERTARKRPKGGWQTYDPKELEWIEAVIQTAIRRLGEFAAGVNPLRKLTMADFPPLPPSVP